MLQNINIMFKIFLFITIVFSNIQICPAPCNFDDCEADNSDTAAGMYDDFCIESRLFKPYVKIYKSRGGKLLEKDGPKLYPIPEDATHDDIYVCINGPAWLYRAKHLPLGVVFHKPEFHVYTHECQFYNGKKGPESHTEQDRLMAILLMGDESDYRRPSMQLFTAPLYNEGLKAYENVTSVMTFGPSECFIERGTKDNRVVITIKPLPDLEKPNSYCKLAYQNIDQIYDPSNPAFLSYAQEQWGNNEQTKVFKALLKNDVALKQMPCLKNDVIPKLPDPTFVKTFVDSKKNLIEPQKKNFERDLISYKLIDLTALGQNDDSAQGKLDTAVGIILNPDNNKTPEQIEQAKADKKKAEEAIAKNERITEAVKHCENFKDPPTPPAETMETKYGTLFNDALEKLSLKDSDPSKKTLLEQLQVAKDEWNNEKTDIKKQAYELVWTNVKEALKLYSQSYATAVIKSHEAEEVYKQCRRAMERIGNPLLPEFGFRGGVIAIPPEYAPNAGAAKVDNCKELPTLEGTCKKVKPNKNRACQFLKSIVDKPEICLQDEVGENEAPAILITDIPAETTTKKHVGETNTEILDLIKDIFDEACTHFFPENTFADRITRVFKCYLMKPIKFEGAGMKENENSNELSGPKTNAHMVTQILEALRVCRDEKRKLRFRKDPNSGQGKKEQKYQYWNNSMWVDVHLHSEQADKEFAFNFAIDMHFKMFTTVMGLCMPSHGYNNRNALISSMFYATYSRIFYAPLKFQWTNPADNRIFNLLLGNFKNQNGDLYANHCMEASFIHGGDTDYRPPRYLFVNGNTEANFFTTGRLANKNHKYLSAFK